MNTIINYFHQCPRVHLGAQTSASLSAEPGLLASHGRSSRNADFLATVSGALPPTAAFSRRRLLLQLAWGLLTTGLVTGLEAEPLDEWHQRSPTTQSENLTRIAFGQGIFIALGEWGGIQTSSDGINWTWRQSGYRSLLFDILATEHLFVAVGGEGAILTSKDAESWVPRLSGTTDPLWAVAYGNNRFVALGSHRCTNEPQSVVATSVDGTNWTASLVEMGGTPLGLTFGHGTFVAAVMGANQQPSWATSLDGLTWDRHAWPTDQFPSRLTYGNGQFVAVGGNCGLGGCSGSIVASLDAVNWTPAAFQPRFLREVAFGRDQFVAVGGNCDVGGCDSLIVTSGDGESWVPRRAATQATLTSVAFGNDTFVVLGENGLILQSDPLTDTPPSIRREPVDQTAPAGSTLMLSVVAVGTSPLTYQWAQGGKTLAGATNATLGLTNVQLLDTGEYVVTVGNAFGMAVSRPAALVVEPLGPLDHWNWRAPTPQGGPLKSVVFGSNNFLAGGDGGFVLSSPNAVSWDLMRDASIPGLISLAYGNGRYVGATANGGIAVSVDGLHWVTQDAGGGAALSRVVYGGGLFVGIAGQAGATNVLTSPDGVAWTMRDAGTTNALLGLTHGAGIFLAVGEHGTVSISSDGLAWRAQNTGIDSTLELVAFGDELFVAAGSSGYYQGLVVTSPDGLNWTLAPYSGVDLTAIAWGNGVWVAAGGTCGKYGCNPGLVTSSDGRHWTARNTDQIQFRNQSVHFSLAFGLGTFALVNQDGTILTSADGCRWQARNDGIRWQQRHAGAVAHVGAISQGAGIMVAVGAYWSPYHSAALIWSSTDGVNWTEGDLPADVGQYTGLSTVTFGNGTFVAVGSGGTFLTSSNGMHWVPHATPDGVDMGTVFFADGRFVAADAPYLGCASIWTSVDGEKWVGRYSATNVLFFNFARGSGVFVAVGQTNNQGVQQSLVLSSADGLTWTPREVPGTALSDVAFGNGQFVATAFDCGAVDCAPLVLTSPDGMTWTAQSSPNDPLLNHIAFGCGYFTAVGTQVDYETSLYFSTDGVHWFNGHVGGMPALYGVNFAANTFWALGENGAILQSDPLLATRPAIAKAPLAQTVFAGNTASLQVIATGSSPLTYQWFKNGDSINGATNASLAWRTADLQDEGAYFIMVSNAFGTAVIQPVRLAVQMPPEAAELGLELNPWAELTLLGRTGRTYELQSTDCLQDPNTWRAVARLSLPSVPFTWTDTLSPPSGRRFYRAVLLP